MALAIPAPSHSIPRPVHPATAAAIAVARRARLAEVRVSERGGACEVELESSTHPGFLHTLTVDAAGVASHAPGSLDCPAATYGRTCSHVVKAPLLADAWQRYQAAAACYADWLRDEESAPAVRREGMRRAQREIATALDDVVALGCQFVGVGG